MKVGERVGTHRVRAHNEATESDNKIHDDSVARLYGFAGGLVPGITVYAYMTRPVAALWGLSFLERGSMSARFLRPFYEGEFVVVTADATEVSPGRTVLALTATDESGEARATGTATLDQRPRATPDASRWPVLPLPATRPPASEEAFSSVSALGCVGARCHPLANTMDTDLALYREAAHPGWLVRFANDVLTANVALGPWIHVDSDAMYLRPVRDGDHVEARALVADLFVRKGHRFVRLDVLLVVDGSELAARIRHTAIYDIHKEGP